jgi:hypothetical protein
MNHFQKSREYPFHISVGAIVINKEKNVACHYFKSLAVPDFGNFEDFYILMRETIEPNETIEECLARGLKEEFGAEASLRHFIGSIVSEFPLTKEGPIVEKTTLYFLCDLISIDPNRRNKEDLESKSDIMWLPPRELMSKMSDQSKRLKRKDADESGILKKALPYI